MLKIQEKNSDLYVVIPFAAKDDLRRNFPKAKWHPESKQWSVTIEARERLEQWCDAVRSSSLASNQAETDRCLMTAKELERTEAAIVEAKAKLEGYKKSREDIEQLKSKLAKSRSTLVNMRDFIDAQKAEMEREEAEEKSKKDEIDATLAGIVDQPTLAAAFATMKRFDGAISRADIGEWQTAQDVLIDARNCLRNANLCHEALEYLAEVKQGRDLTRCIPPGAWYSITKLKA